jgi:ferritin
MLANEPGVRIPETLPTEVIEIFDARIGDEYTAHYFYRNAANWCKNVNYAKAAAFFEAEAANEMEHALGLQNYLIQWNLMPEIPSVPTKETFTSLVDIINKAYDLEYGLYLKYSADQNSLDKVHPASFNFIQKYTDIQTASVAEYSDLLNALQLISTENKLDILYFEKRYF